MFRNAFLALALSITLLGCIPAGGNGPQGNSQCRIDLSNHCTGVCATRDGFAVGYIAIIPENQFRCVCKYPEVEKPGLAF